MTNSISALSAGLLQQSIGTTNSKYAAAIANIASGKRNSQASEDISSLSVATSLQTGISGLRSAALNITQASSMLQVADGGMGQIGAILDRMSQLATQANSGSLNTSDREGLNTEFQSLANEIDRIAGNTNFNNVPLLNGAQSIGNTLETVTSKGEQADGALQFTSNVGAGQTITLNKVTLTEGVDFKAGATTEQTVQNLSTALNNDKRFDGFTFKATNATLDIKADAAGSAGNQFTISKVNSTAAFDVIGDSLTGAGTFSLQGGTDAGVSSGDIKVGGDSGDSIITPQKSQQAATTAFKFNKASDIAAGDTIKVDNGEGGQTTFTFVKNTPATNTEIQIGSGLNETLQNAAITINQYKGADDFGVRQLNATVQGNDLVLTNKAAGNATDVNGAALSVALNTTGGTVTNTQLNNGSNGGVDTSGLTVADASGGIKDFKATFNGPNNVTLSAKVGGETFRATVTNTAPAVNTTVRFTSEKGGFFDVTLAGGKGTSVSNQQDADVFASRLNTATSTLKLNQTRDVENFKPAGFLHGAKLEITGSGFNTTQQVDDLRVTTGGATSKIDITVNGQTFRSGAISSTIVAGQQVTLTGDNGDIIKFTNGTQKLDLSNSSSAALFQTALQASLGGGGNNGLPFQIGATSSDKVNFAIGNLTSKALFSGQTFNLLSASGAEQASAVVGSAIDTLTTQRADVGAFQSALNYTAANLNSAIQNQEAARSELTDTDLASESTLDALLKVQEQAGITALAQTNRLTGNMLQLLVK